MTAEHPLRLRKAPYNPWIMHDVIRILGSVVYWNHPWYITFLSVDSREQKPEESGVVFDSKDGDQQISHRMMESQEDQVAWLWSKITQDYLTKIRHVGRFLLGCIIHSNTPKTVSSQSWAFVHVGLGLEAASFWSHFNMALLVESELGFFGESKALCLMCQQKTYYQTHGG